MPTESSGSVQVNVRLPQSLVRRLQAYNHRGPAQKLTEVLREVAERGLDVAGTADGRVSVRLALDHHRAAMVDLLGAVQDEDPRLAAQLAEEAGRQLVEWAELRREEAELREQADDLDKRLEEAGRMAARLRVKP